MELFYRCADPERRQQGREAKRLVTCSGDSPSDRNRQVFFDDDPEGTFIRIRNDLDNDVETHDMMHQPCKDPTTMAILTSHIARQLAIIGDEVNDLYRREFTGIMYDIGLTLNGNRGNRFSSIYSLVCEGLLCDVTVKRLNSLISHLTSAKQSDSSTLSYLYKCIQQNVTEFISDNTAILTSTSVIVTSFLAVILAYKNSAR